MTVTAKTKQTRQQNDCNMDFSSFSVKREAIVKTVSLILRVPSLFILEAWYRNDPRVLSKQIDIENSNYAFNPDDVTKQNMAKLLYYSALILAFLLAFLPLRKLVNFYVCLLCTGLLLIANYISHMFIVTDFDKTSHLQTLRSAAFPDVSSVCDLPESDSSYCHLAKQDITMCDIAEGNTYLDRYLELLFCSSVHILLQLMIVTTVSCLLSLRMPSTLVLTVYLAPIIGRCVCLPSVMIPRMHSCASLIVSAAVAVYILNNMSVVLDLIKSAVNKITYAVHHFGWLPFIMAVWVKIQLPVQFLLFWILLFVVQFYRYLSIDKHPIFNERWPVILLASIGECCVTPVSLFGICTTVSYVSYLILTGTRFYLQGYNPQQIGNTVMQKGWTEGLTMLLLAVQMGLIELKAPQRAFLMSIVLFFVLSSLMESMYEMADPFLLELGASRSSKVFRHMRAVSLCMFLVGFPSYMIYVICQFFDLDFWLLVVVSSCVLTAVQSVGSLSVYMLFVVDMLTSSADSEPWHQLDDLVYYVKAATRVFEFAVAVFVVGYGIHESLFRQWSFINAAILVVHCYLNVWMRLQIGWKSYLLRRDAVRKVESLHLATKEELNALNDVCSICYQNMNDGVRQTMCKHYYHGVCLRKWLHIQEKCPMCHKRITMETDEGLDGKTPSL